MDDQLQQRINRRKQTLAEIKEELADRLQLEASPEAIDDDTYLFGGGLQLDSIDSMEIIIGLQAKFGVEVPEGDVAPLRTINTLADLVEAHQMA
jgi:acyl carrier protein